MKKTRLSSVVSLLAAGVLMGGCTADIAEESEGGAAQEPNLDARVPGPWAARGVRGCEEEGTGGPLQEWRTGVAPQR